jgi:hypothetical protein
MSYSRATPLRKQPCLACSALWAALCFIATLGAGTAIAAESRLALREVRSSVDEGVFELDAKLEIELPEDARKAVEAGLTLTLTYEVEVSRVRRYMLDDGIATLEQRYEVSYHALSQRYLVRNLNTAEQQDFGTLRAALDRVGDLRGLPVLDTALISDDAVYQGRIRAVLGLNSAPDVLGWLLFWTDDWSATSDWKSWTLQP